jgi:hypothetical protein
MSDTELNNTSDFSREKMRLVTLLLIYCVGVSICRLTGPLLRFISYVDWTSIANRRALLERMPYYLIPIAGVIWLRRSECSRASLLFIQIISLIEACNHCYAVYLSIRPISLGLPFIQLSGREGLGRIFFILIGAILAFLFMITAAVLFRRAGRLRKYQENEGDTTSVSWRNLILLLFCYVSPFMDYKNISEDISVSIFRLLNNLNSARI